MILRGRSISPGAFEGRAQVLDARSWIDAAGAVPAAGGSERESERLRAALARACIQLELSEQELYRVGRGEGSGIFAAHLAMMRDPVLLDGLEHAISDEGLSAEAAIARVTSALHREFDSSTMSMVRDKAPDVLDIGHRLLRCLGPRVDSGPGAARPLVIVASVLTASELVRFANQAAVAALTETCGERSHAAILARSLGVPLLTGLGGVTRQVADGALILLDAERGLALVDPGEEEALEAKRIRAAIAASSTDGDRSQWLARQPVTRDGTPIRLALNASGTTEAAQVSPLGAAGIGLLRTEFLYMDRSTWPDEETCLHAYEAIAAAAGEVELAIRLADFGADKRPEYADFAIGRNPSLGVRGVRLLLQRDDLLGPQARALGRLATQRPVALLVPMLDSVDTLRRLGARLVELLRPPGGTLPFRVGAMIEVPAAALTIDEILAEVDLAAIGLNDLTQYVMAADREDESVQRYHDALQPAVLRLVRQVVAAGDAHRKPISVCGELAGDPSLTAALLAVGVRNFSVSRADYRRAVERIEQLSVPALEARRGELLSAATGGEVRAILEAV